MTQKYDIESLIKIFEKYEIKIDFNNGETELYLSKALYEICREIKSLKEKIEKNNER